MAIRRLLSMNGADVTVVADGSEAVDLVVTQGVSYNLAFFDINMPIMDGIKAMHLIRNAAIDLPIIALTASIDKVELQSYQDEGFSMVTTKPLRVSTCREILSKYGHVLPPDSTMLRPAIHAPSSSSSTLSFSQVEDVHPGRGDTSRKQYVVLVVEDNGEVTLP